MINQKTRDLIVEFEGLRLVAYKDGGGIWTIGVGHTSDSVQKVYAGLTITRERAFELLDIDIKEAEDAVLKYVKVSLNPNQYGSLSSWTFNLGAGALQSSTLLKKLNKGDYKGAADEMLKWDHDDGKKIPGLTRRRVAERALFLSPTDVSQTPVETPPVSEPPKHGEAPVVPLPVAKKGILDILFDILIKIFKRN